MLICDNSFVLLLSSNVSSAKKGFMMEITVGKSRAEKRKRGNFSVLVIWEIMVLDVKSQFLNLKYSLFGLFYLE